MGCDVKDINLTIPYTIYSCFIYIQFTDHGMCLQCFATWCFDE